MNKQERKNLEIVDKIIMFILVGIVPFLVYYQNAHTPDEQLAMMNIQYDYFNYVKVNVILFLTVVIVFVKGADFISTIGTFVFSDKVKKWLRNPYVILGSLIVVTTLLSFFFSDYKETALKGAMERYESIWVHFSYVIIFAFSIDFFRKKGSFELFSKAVLLGTFVVGTIGTLQAFGYQPLNSPFIASFTQNALPEEAGGAIFNLSGSYSTLYNINTSASYALFMMFILVLVFLKNKQTYIKAIACIDFLLLGITLFNSKSEATYIALVISLIAMVIFSIFALFTSSKKKEAYIVIGIALIIVFTSIIAYLSVNPVTTKINGTIASAMGEQTVFSDWAYEDNIIHLYNYKDDDFAITTYVDYFEIYENDKLLGTYKYDEFSEEAIQTENFDIVNLNRVIVEEVDNLLMQVNGSYIYFVLEELPFIVNGINLVEVDYYDSIGFEKNLAMFTYRGFIWSRALPILFDSLLYGKGADTFMLVFPNHDYMGRWFATFPETILVDKPHNIYLNMAISNGCVYLLSFLSICMLVLFEKIKLIYNKDKLNIDKTAIVVYLGGFVAYLVNGMSTDNIVVIIMLFWVYLGFGKKIFIIE